jgi:hypothetical protein
MPVNAPAKPDSITRAGLVGKRGWTDAAVTRFLGAPDVTAPNPHYRSGPPMGLYALERVERIEATPEFQTWRMASLTRQSRALCAVETKRRRLAEYVAGLRIAVPVLDAAELLCRAVESYNDHQYSRQLEREERGREFDWTPASADGIDAAFAERITVNYLRHRLTRYERELARVYGRVGVDDAKRELRAKVYAAIAAAYPALAAECARQRAERGDAP